jgi:uncharacterized protein (TIGR03067 family)
VDELQDFQGTWQAVWLAADGRKMPAAEIGRTRLTIAGDRYTFHFVDHEWSGAIDRVDRTGKNRGPVDFVAEVGKGKAEKFLGIYLVADDELTFCVAPAGQERPTSFSPRRGSGHRLYLLKKEVSSSVRLVEERFPGQPLRLKRSQA